MTRHVFISLIACIVLWPSMAHAQQPGLTGVWKLTSFVVESVQTKERRNIYGEKPVGYLVITPERFTAIITGEGRKPPDAGIVPGELGRMADRPATDDG